MATFLAIGPDQIDADAATRVEVEYRAEVTQYPVERGVDLTDHLRAEPRIYGLELVVTDDPLERQQFAPNAQRARAVVERLDQAQQNAELVTLISDRVGVVANLAIQRIGETYEAPVRGIVIPVELIQVEVAEARTVTLPVPATPRGARGKNKGRQVATEANATQSQSILSKLTGLGTAVGQ